MMSLPTFQTISAVLDFSQWELAIQSFFCDSTQGGGMFVKPPDNWDTERETWVPPVGLIPFFTGFQAHVFQKQRPRVSLGPINYSQVEEVRIQDATGRLWRNGWKVPVETFVVTPADYKYHTQLLAQVRAIYHFMNPTPIDPITGLAAQANIATTGLNAFLTNHSCSRMWDAGGPTFGGHLTDDNGFYLTPMKHNAVFAVPMPSTILQPLNA